MRICSVRTRIVIQVLVRYLRFAARNGREAGWKAWSSHVSVRIKPLEEQK